MLITPLFGFTPWDEASRLLNSICLLPRWNKDWAHSTFPPTTNWNFLGTPATQIGILFVTVCAWVKDLLYHHAFENRLGFGRVSSTDREQGVKGEDRWEGLCSNSYTHEVLISILFQTQMKSWLFTERSSVLDSGGRWNWQVINYEAGWLLCN